MIITFNITIWMLLGLTQLGHSYFALLGCNGTMFLHSDQIVLTGPSTYTPNFTLGQVGYTPTVVPCHCTVAMINVFTIVLTSPFPTVFSI